jgi:hypothetical protein
MPEATPEPAPPAIDAAQLLLAEKRTALSVLRTGASIFVLPLSVLSLLIATSKLYQTTQVLHLMIPLLVLCGVLAVVAIFLIVRSLAHLRHYDRLLSELKRRDPALGRLLD